MITSGSRGTTRKRRLDRREGRPYILKPLLENFRLAGDDITDDVHIVCVEYWSVSELFT